MREYKETFIISIRGVCLDLHIVLLKEFPVVSVFEARLNKDTVEVGREVLASHDLTNEVDLGLKVSASSHPIAQCLQLIHLLLLQVFQLLLIIVAQHVGSLLLRHLLIVLAWTVCVHLPTL